MSDWLMAPLIASVWFVGCAGTYAVTTTAKKDRQKDNKVDCLCAPSSAWRQRSRNDRNLGIASLASRSTRIEVLWRDGVKD